MPFVTPSTEPGVEGVFNTNVSPVCSFITNMSVNVPPMSTPSRYLASSKPRLQVHLSRVARAVRSHPTGAGTTNMDLATARRELVMANRILANEGILDAFGHVTVRHPEHADRFIMAWARAPELVEDADLLEFTLDGTVIDAGGRVPYLERSIHAAIYEQRPEVMAVCHNHTLSILPFSISK